MAKFVFAIGLLLALSGPASAKPGDPPASEPRFSTTDLYYAEDTHTGEAYRALMAHLEPAEQASLRASQRRWIQSRNRACGFETKSKCTNRLTRARGLEFESMMVRQTAWRHWPDRRLIQFADTMHATCKDIGQDPDGPICRRRDEAFDMLARRGWCWGPTMAVADEQHWMRPGRLCKP
jgi:Lysozyme inhibitor LprI